MTWDRGFVANATKTEGFGEHAAVAMWPRRYGEGARWEGWWAMAEPSQVGPKVELLEPLETELRKRAKLELQLQPIPADCPTRLGSRLSKSAGGEGPTPKSQSERHTTLSEITPRQS